MNQLKAKRKDINHQVNWNKKHIHIYIHQLRINSNNHLISKEAEAGMLNNFKGLKRRIT